MARKANAAQFVEEAPPPETPKDPDEMSQEEHTSFMSQMADEPPEEEQQQEATPPEPEGEEGEDELDATAAKPSETVPHKKFHQANDRRKAAEAKARDAESKVHELAE